MEEPDSFNLFDPFRSTYFRLATSLVAMVLAGAYLTNFVYLSFTHRPNVWFLVADRLARAIVASCTILGYFGLFVWPLGFAQRDIEHLFWRQSAQRVRYGCRNAGRALMVTLVTLGLGLQIGFGSLFDITLRIADDLTNLALLVGLEVAEAYFWQVYLRREHFRG